MAKMTTDSKNCETTPGSSLSDKVLNDKIRELNFS